MSVAHWTLLTIGLVFYLSLNTGLLAGELPKEYAKIAPIPLAATKLDQPRVEIPIPEKSQHFVLAANGRYVLIPLNNKLQVAVFDVNELKIVRFWPMVNPRTIILGGATRAVLIHPESNKIDRYRLDTLELEGSTTIPGTGTVRTAGMGMNSEGPICVERIVEQGKSKGLLHEFWDLQTLQILPKKFLGNYEYDRNIKSVSLSNSHHIPIVASAAGNSFGVTGTGFIRLWGDYACVIVSTSYRMSMISNLGEAFFSEHQYYNRAMSQAGLAPKVAYGPTLLPTQGNLLLTTVDSEIDTPNLHFRKIMQIRVVGQIDGLLKFPGIQLPGSLLYHSEAMGAYLEQANIVFDLSLEKPQLILTQLDFQAEFKKLKKTAIVPLNQPQLSAQLGKKYSSKLHVLTNNPEIKFELLYAPLGMIVTAAGEIQWSVPADYPFASHLVVVQMTSADGTQALYPYYLEIQENMLTLLKNSYERNLPNRPTPPRVPREKVIDFRRDIKNFSSPFDYTHWIDATGNFTREAIYVETINREKVVLELKDGKRIQISHAQLGLDDQIRAIRYDLLFAAEKLKPRPPRPEMKDEPRAERAAPERERTPAEVMQERFKQDDLPTVIAKLKKRVADEQTSREWAIKREQQRQERIQKMNALQQRKDAAREWTDPRSGQKISAKFLELKVERIVSLQPSQGEPVEFELEKMNVADKYEVLLFDFLTKVNDEDRAFGLDELDMSNNKSLPPISLDNYR